MAKYLQFCQWTMAVAPGHPITKCAMDTLLSKLEANDYKYEQWDAGTVLEITGMLIHNPQF